jgi:hypothetical protein
MWARHKRVRSRLRHALRMGWLTELWTNTLVGIVGTLVTLGGIVAALWSVRRGRATLRVNLATATVIGDQMRYPSLRLGVTNDSPANAQLGRVAIEEPRGRQLRTTFRDGPRCPTTLNANGGNATWMFDLRQVEEEARTGWLGQRVELRGVIQVGGRRFRTNQTVTIVGGRMGPVKSAWKERATQWWSSVTRPGVQLLGAYRVTEENLRAGTCELVVLNTGRGFAAPRKIGLVVEGDDGIRHAMSEMLLHRCGWIRPGRQVMVSLPLVDKDSLGEGKYWWTMPGALHAIGALTRQEAEQMLRAHRLT